MTESPGDVLRQISQTGTKKTKEIAEMALLFQAVGETAVQKREQSVRFGAVSEVSASLTGSTLNSEGAMEIYGARQRAIASEYAPETGPGQLGAEVYRAAGGPTSRPPIDPHRDATSQLLPFAQPQVRHLPPPPPYKSLPAVTQPPVTAVYEPVHQPEPQAIQLAAPQVVYRQPKKAARRNPSSARHEDGSVLDLVLTVGAIAVILLLLIGRANPGLFDGLLGGLQSRPSPDYISPPQNTFPEEDPPKEPSSSSGRTVIEVTPLPVHGN